MLKFVGVAVSWPVEEPDEGRPVEEAGEGRSGPVCPGDELMRWEMEVKKMSTPTRRRVTKVAISQVALRRPEPAWVG